MGGGGGGLTRDLKLGAEETLLLAGLYFSEKLGGDSSPGPAGSAVPGFRPVF